MLRVDNDHKIKAKCIFIDDYRDLSELISEEQTHAPVVIFEDNGHRSSPAVKLVISAFGNKLQLKHRYPNARICCGIGYLSFRAEIQRAKIQNRVQHLNATTGNLVGMAQQMKVIITFGATVQQDLINRVIRVLDGILHESCAVTVYAPIEFNFPDCDRPIHFEPITEAFLRNVVTADLVICAAGQTFLELLYIGIPVVGLVIAANQIDCATHLRSLGATVIEFLDSLEAELTQILLEKWPRLHKNTTEIINEFNESNESGERNKQISTRIQDLIGYRETKLLSHLSNLIL
ncbi:MAG: hypothetical protein MI864_00820 [Pseudomonadales bacterium]|nr:hypothetical protein [Pseudomonadales bacterium]